MENKQQKVEISRIKRESATLKDIAAAAYSVMIKAAVANKEAATNKDIHTTVNGPSAMYTFERALLSVIDITDKAEYSRIWGEVEKAVAATE
jgi:hypothetical protein